MSGRAELEWRLTLPGKTWALRSLKGSLKRRLLSLYKTLTVTICSELERSRLTCDGDGVAMMYDGGKVEGSNCQQGSRTLKA